MEKSYKLQYSYTHPSNDVEYIPVIFTLNDKNKGHVINYNTLNLTSERPVREMKIIIIYSYCDNIIIGKKSHYPFKLDLKFCFTAVTNLLIPYSPTNRYFGLRLELSNLIVYVNGSKSDSYKVNEESIKIANSINKELVPIYKDMSSIDIDLFDGLKIPIDMHVRHIHSAVLDKYIHGDEYIKSKNRIPPTDITISIE